MKKGKKPVEMHDLGLLENELKHEKSKKKHFQIAAAIIIIAVIIVLIAAFYLL